MSRDKKFTYVLYFTINYDLEDIILLGTSTDPSKLFYNGLNSDIVNKETNPHVLKWLELVERNLDQQELHDLEYAFMYNPEKEFSYNIQNMTLHIKKIKNFI